MRPGNCVKCGVDPSDSWGTDSIGRVWCPRCTDVARMAAVPPKHPEVRALLIEALAKVKVLSLKDGFIVEDIETALRRLEAT